MGELWNYMVQTVCVRPSRNCTFHIPRRGQKGSSKGRKSSSDVVCVNSLQTQSSLSKLAVTGATCTQSSLELTLNLSARDSVSMPVHATKFRRRTTTREMFLSLAARAARTSKDRRRWNTVCYE